MAMKVILRSDVDNLGRLGQVVKVKDGYGRNYLIPQGLAMRATASNMKVFETERARLQSKNDAVRFEASSLAEKLAAFVVAIPVRVGESDKLYGSVTNATIYQVLADNGMEFDRRKILLEEPIRALGTYSIPVKLHPDVQVDLTVKVVRHDTGETGEKAAAPAEEERESESQPEEAV